MGDGFYRSKDPNNSIKVLKVHIVHRQIKQTIITILTDKNNIKKPKQLRNMCTTKPNATKNWFKGFYAN